MSTMHTVIILLIDYFVYLQSISSTDYTDHVSCIESNFELHPMDRIFSLDKNTKFEMKTNGEWILQSRTDSTSQWSQLWSTNTPSSTITSIHPSFAVQRDANLVVYSAEGSIWQANIALPCCETYHFIVHNGGYAYLLHSDYSFARFTTNTSITPTSDPTLYPPPAIITGNPTSCTFKSKIKCPLCSNMNSTNIH